jgi:hypothetical protein
MFLLLLYKTYNLPYTSGMSAQEGILLTIFICVMFYRISQGISANKVSFIISVDIRLFENGRIHIFDFGWNIFLHILYAASVLCDAD